MRKILAKILVVAIAEGMVVETALCAWRGEWPVDRVVELCILWAIALGVSVVTAWKAINGTLVQHHYHTEYVEREPEPEDDDPEDDDPDEPNETSNT